MPNDASLQRCCHLPEDVGHEALAFVTDRRERHHCPLGEPREALQPFQVTLLPRRRRALRQGAHDRRAARDHRLVGPVVEHQLSFVCESGSAAVRS